MDAVERVARAIYWVGFVSRGALEKFPNFTKEIAWGKAGPDQQDFCKQQAVNALEAYNVWLTEQGIPISELLDGSMVPASFGKDGSLNTTIEAYNRHRKWQDEHD